MTDRMNTTNPVLDDYLARIMLEDTKAETTVKRFRKYEDGDQPSQITDVQIERLGHRYDDNFRIQMNICKTILSVEADRLMADGQSVNDQTLSEEQIDALNNAMLKTWQASAMDLASHSFHYGAIRDGDGYLILEYDSFDQQAVMHYNKAYDGDTGVKVVYSDVNNPQSALYAFKIWSELDPKKGIKENTKRLNVYWDNRIEFYIWEHGSWQPHFDDAYLPTDESASDTDTPQTQRTVSVRLENPFKDGTYTAAVQWITDTGLYDGSPLGIPVVHYPHNAMGSTAGESGLVDIVPSMQDNLNIAMVDTMMNSRFSGTPLTMLAGMPIDSSQLTNDQNGGKKLEIEAGGVIASSNPDAKAQILIGTNLEALISNKNDILKNIATLTQTPLVFFNMTGQLPAEGSLAALQESLHFKITKDQKALGNIYQNAQRYALKLHMAYDPDFILENTTDNLALINELDINTAWGESIRTPMTDKIEVAKGLIELKIPYKTVYQDALGYDVEKATAVDDDRLEAEKVKINATLAAAIQLEQSQRQQQSGNIETTNTAPTDNQINQLNNVNGNSDTVRLRV